MANFTTESYPQLLRYRNEGLQKVGARFMDDLEAPRARSFFPTLWKDRPENAYPGLRFAGWRISLVGPSMIVAAELVGRKPALRVLDIGCAHGNLRAFLTARRPGISLEYVGVDIAPPEVDFRVYRTLDDVPEGRFDLVMLSEVAEHMTADAFVDSYLQRLPALMKPDGTAIVGVPNPLAPTVLWRDVTHVQHYPWFDLYALLRFFFEEVDVLRTHVIHTPRRLLMYPLRRALSFALEMDWCEGLTLVARRPKRPT